MLPQVVNSGNNCQDLVMDTSGVYKRHLEVKFKTLDICVTGFRTHFAITFVYCLFVYFSVDSLE